jgi:hypothetical protein
VWAVKDGNFTSFGNRLLDVVNTANEQAAALGGRVDVQYKPTPLDSSSVLFSALVTVTHDAA